MCELKIFILGQLCSIDACLENILKKKCLFIKMSIYQNVFLSNYCAQKCLVCISPNEKKF